MARADRTRVVPPERMFFFSFFFCALEVNVQTSAPPPLFHGVSIQWKPLETGRSAPAEISCIFNRPAVALFPFHSTCNKPKSGTDACLLHKHLMLCCGMRR